MQTLHSMLEREVWKQLPMIPDGLPSIRAALDDPSVLAAFPFDTSNFGDWVVHGNPWHMQAYGKQDECHQWALCSCWLTMCANAIAPGCGFSSGYLRKVLSEKALHWPREGTMAVQYPELPEQGHLFNKRICYCNLFCPKHPRTGRACCANVAFLH